MKNTILIALTALSLCISCNRGGVKSKKDAEIETSTGKDPLKDFIYGKTDTIQVADSIDIEFLISLLDSINNDEFVDNKLYSLDFFEKTNGYYVSDQRVGQYPKHWMDVTKFAGIISFHTADSVFWDKLRQELKTYGKQEQFKEGSYEGTRYVDSIYTFESLRPTNGVDLADHTTFDIYVFKTERYHKH